MDDAIRLIRELAQQGFYGSLTLKFEAGQVVVLKKEETIKPYCRNNRSERNGERL